MATGSTLNYGLDLNGKFASLLAFQARNVYSSLPTEAIRTLGGEQFVDYKRKMNTLGPFYDTPGLDDPSKSTSRGPGYQKLSENLESFIATVKLIADIVRSAFAEKVAYAGSVEEDSDAKR